MVSHGASPLSVVKNLLDWHKKIWGSLYLKICKANPPQTDCVYWFLLMTHDNTYQIPWQRNSIFIVLSSLSHLIWIHVWSAAPKMRVNIGFSHDIIIAWVRSCPWQLFLLLSCFMSSVQAFSPFAINKYFVWKQDSEIFKNLLSSKQVFRGKQRKRYVIKTTCLKRLRGGTCVQKLHCVLCT